ncbi:hypothetical protein G9A89_013705 [Geosiphon pyriformis]|nr:hypothetical protein G9A89_013705 [Geosiphon pyriformis]
MLVLSVSSSSVGFDMVADFSSNSFKVLIIKVSGLESKMVTLEVLINSVLGRSEDYQSPKNLTQQQESISTSTNIIEYLQKNESNHSKNLESKETESEQKETTENKEKMATAYIAKIPEFTGKDNDTSPQKWLDKVQKAGNANGWNTARMLKAIPYFLQETAKK